MCRLDAALLCVLFLGAATSGCVCGAGSTGDDDDDDGGTLEDDDHDWERDDPAATIEESDLYRIDGDRLYVYGYSRGLTVLDVADAAAPVTLGQLALAGPAGELYARAGAVSLLLESPGESCTLRFGPDDALMSSELVTIDAAAPESAAVLTRICLSGSLVASRLVGDRLYAVTSEESYYGDSDARSWVLAIDLSDPVEPVLEASLALAGPAREIHVSADHSLYIAQAAYGEDWLQNTHLRRIDLEVPGQVLAERGSIVLAGAPAGRFHMDAAGPYFRIVTYDESQWESLLQVVDYSAPDAPAVAGGIAIGYGEQLYATRFDGDRAYVVTFRQTDPLWVVDLSEPSSPSLLGELVVPGWSNFIFPRGNRLLTVGRGDGGSGVALALFDVSDPASPSTIEQLTFGDWSSSSEADFDFRGLGILEAGAVSTQAVIALPVNRSSWNSETGTYGCENTLHLLTLEGDVLAQRAELARSARVRRSFAHDGRLYSLSDLSLSAMDATDPSNPQALAEVVTGDEAFLAAQCPYPISGGGMWGADMGMSCGGCSVSGTRASPLTAALSFVFALAGLALLSLRRRIPKVGTANLP